MSLKPIGRYLSGGEMSIARWGVDGSDVYIIGAAKEWECVGCDGPGAVVSIENQMAFLDHLQWHRDQGHSVPYFVETNLRWYYHPSGRPLSDAEIGEKVEAEAR